MPKKCQELGCESTVADSDVGSIPFCERHARERGYQLLRCRVCCLVEWIQNPKGEEPCGTCLQQCGETVERDVIKGPLPDSASLNKTMWPPRRRFASQWNQFWQPASSKKDFEEGEQLLVAHVVIETKGIVAAPAWNIESVTIDIQADNGRPWMCLSDGSFMECSWGDISWYMQLQDLRCTLPELPAPCSPGDQPTIDKGVLTWKSEGVGVSRGETDA